MALQPDASDFDLSSSPGIFRFSHTTCLAV
jgi:hypothetical protein